MVYRSVPAAYRKEQTLTFLTNPLPIYSVVMTVKTPYHTAGWLEEIQWATLQSVPPKSICFIVSKRTGYLDRISTMELSTKPDPKSFPAVPTGGLF